MSDIRQRRPPAFGGAAAAAHGPRALSLAAELRLLASELEAEAAGREAPARGVADLAAFAETVRAARDQFARSVGEDCVTDPPLDILLDAFVAEETGRAEGTAPVKTPIAIQRWATLLTERGLLAAELPPRLTSAGRAVICRYVATLSGHAA